MELKNDLISTDPVAIVVFLARDESDLIQDQITLVEGDDAFNRVKGGGMYGKIAFIVKAEDVGDLRFFRNSKKHI